jgi:hypothetical protein
LLLPDAGRYTVFYEYEGVVNGKRYSTGKTMPAFTLTLTHKATGEKAPLTGTRVGGYSGSERTSAPVMDFTIHRSGEYVLRATYPPEGAPGEVILAIGHDAFRNSLLMWGGVFVSGVLCCASVVAWLALLLLALLTK